MGNGQGKEGKEEGEGERQRSLVQAVHQSEGGQNEWAHARFEEHCMDGESYIASLEHELLGHRIIA